MSEPDIAIATVPPFIRPALLALEAEDRLVEIASSSAIRADDGPI